MTQETTHLYGCTEPDIDAIAAAIGPTLDLQLENRDSAYWGDYHIDRSGAYSELKLYRNLDPMFSSDADDPDEYWFEPDFRDCDALLSVYAAESVLLDFHRRIANVTPKFRLLKPSTIGT
ncbi:MAG: hypothetical protein NXI22_13900 [bacterium]|nr:hypothetical protein [bacterium]